MTTASPPASAPAPQAGNASTMTLIDALRMALGHYNAGRLGEAEAMCRAILGSIPGQLETLHLLGIVASAAKRPEEAVALMRKALAVKPDFPDANSNFGVLRQTAGRLAEAVTLQTRALTINPRSAAAFLNRGSALLAQGMHDAAAADFAQAVELAPEDPQPITNLGAARREQGRVRVALAAHRRALMLAPSHADAWRDLSHVLRETNNLVPARDACARTYRIDPTRTEMLSYYLFIKQAICDWAGYDDLVREIGAIIDADRGVVLPLATLAIDTTTPQQFRAAGMFCERIIRPAPPGPRPAPRGRRADDRIVVGYFSADYHEHATAYLAAEMFELHDRERFRVIAYSFGQDDQSPMRRRLIAAFDEFRDIRGVGLDQVARMVVEDGVDVRVDLKGYTKQSRLELLSRRLAPIEVAYLGYPGTIGGGFMDYVIGDRFVTPMEHQPYYSERLVIMPDAYQINDRHRRVAEVTPSRAECGLPEDGFVFCAFNTTYKITPAVFSVWMRLLHQIPGSVLWLFEANPIVDNNLRREATARGIDPARLIFAPKKPLPDHLVRYRVADLSVDTMPYNGHTTTSDALWVGLPVVTCMGDTFASRVAAGLSSAAGMDELITRSLPEYEALALALARDPARLAALRQRLEATRMTVPLFDSLRFTRHLESAYATMWAIHQAGEAPRPFAVPASPSDGRLG